MFELKPDYEKSKERIEAFWYRELIDRPVVYFTLPKPPAECVPLPASNHDSSGARWLDAQYQAEFALANLRNHEFLGDTLPIVYPNLGPEIFSVFYGCPIHFGDYGTSWTDPILEGWDGVDQLQFDWQSPYLAELHEMTDLLLDYGKGKFIVGMTDWHPGGDAVAAFRDPQNLAVDMLENKDLVIHLLERIEEDYFKVYDIFYEKLTSAGNPCTSWTPLVHDGKYYIPSNDFSIMIGKAMFDEVFLPGITRECRFLDRSIYHLDGPGAIRHLDSLLEISDLNAIQFVPGTGNEVFERWIPLYQKIQKAGKGIQVICSLEEIDRVIETLDPHGVFLTVSGVPNREAGSELVKRLEKWAVQSV